MQWYVNDLLPRAYCNTFVYGKRDAFSIGNNEKDTCRVWNLAVNPGPVYLDDFVSLVTYRIKSVLKLDNIDIKFL